MCVSGNGTINTSPVQVRQVLLAKKPIFQHNVCYLYEYVNYNGLTFSGNSATDLRFKCCIYLAVKPSYGYSLTVFNRITLLTSVLMSYYSTKLN